MNNYLEQLEKRKERMVQYLFLKIEEEDWHAVQDAGSDIREIEAAKAGYEKAVDDRIKS